MEPSPYIAFIHTLGRQRQASLDRQVLGKSSHPVFQRHLLPPFHVTPRIIASDLAEMPILTGAYVSCNA
jgi:hypothetical protein